MTNVTITHINTNVDNSDNYIINVNGENCYNLICEGKTIVDYDGCYELPVYVKETLLVKGFDLSEI